MTLLAFFLGLLLGCGLGIILMACLFVARDDVEEGRMAFHPSARPTIPGARQNWNTQIKEMGRCVRPKSEALRKGWGR